MPTLSGIDLATAKVAVVGATGDIGSAVCRWLRTAPVSVNSSLLPDSNNRFKDLQQELGGGRILSLDEALPEADVVVWVASMPKTLEIDQNKLRQPCLMIDGGYPKNLDSKVSGWQHPRLERRDRRVLPGHRLVDDGACRDGETPATDVRLFR